jgi:hypothetical protein
LSKLFLDRSKYELTYSASHALAEARQEAALFGKERRERIRRRVRESEILREVEELERKQLSAE